MKVAVGSQNPAKVMAVEELLKEYPLLAAAQVTGLDVPSDVSDQPKSLEELTQGATNRAMNAFQDADYSIGIESGFMTVPNAKSGYMNICAAAVYDGSQAHLGLSSAFETPDPEMMRLVIEEGETFDQAAVSAGFTTDPHIGRNTGIIGVLTDGTIDRKEYTKQALRMALVHVIHPVA